MDHPPPFAAPFRPRVQAAVVAVLHPSSESRLAQGMVHAWAPAIPAASIMAVPVDSPSGIADARAQVARRLAQAGLPASSLVLAGVGDGAEAALQLAFGQGALPCAGALACGDSLPPFRVLSGHVAPSRAKLRMVWTSDDPLFCSAALGDLLRCLRSAGLDAQGAVLQRESYRSAEAPGHLHPPLMRLGGAYLAELVAVALGSVGGTCPSRSGTD